MWSATRFRPARSCGRSPKPTPQSRSRRRTLTALAPVRVRSLRPWTRWALVWRRRSRRARAARNRLACFDGAIVARRALYRHDRRRGRRSLWTVEAGLAWLLELRALRVCGRHVVATVICGRRRYSQKLRTDPARGLPDDWAYRSAAYHQVIAERLAPSHDERNVGADVAMWQFGRAYASWSGACWRCCSLAD